MPNKSTEHSENMCSGFGTHFGNFLNTLNHLFVEFQMGMSNKSICIYPGFLIGELNREVTSSDYTPYFHHSRLYDRSSVNLIDVENASVMNMIDELVEKDVNGVITYDLPNEMIIEMQPDSTKRYHLQSNFTPDPSKSYISVDINTIGQVVPINVGLGEQVLVSIYDLLEDTYDFMSPTYYLSGAIYGSSHGHPLGDLNPHGKKEYHYVLPVQADYFIFDHLGSTRLIYHTICEPSGDKFIYELDAVYDYFPFGKMLRDYEANEEKFLFTDKERDDETNYDNFGARYYDSDIGRFMGVDPLVSEMPEWSPYNYTFNNPVKFIDPDGRNPILGLKLWSRIKKAGSDAWNFVTNRRDWSDNGAEQIYIPALGNVRSYGNQNDVEAMKELAGLIPYVEVGFGPIGPQNISAATRLKGRVKALGNIENGQGFSAVYDRSSGSIGYKMSNRDGSSVTLRDGSVNDDVVRQFGGHRSLADTMGGRW
ncbi:MAG: RHS repeat-associated core domain-containing protein [Bacteroidota bacterium]